MITVGSLFAGIGGLELGLEWTGGFKTVWQVENDPYATRVLERHWPNVRRWGDVRTFPPDAASNGSTGAAGIAGHTHTAHEAWHVDLICGGFPCQDISYAGKGAGLDGERSGLFYEAARIIRMLGPRYVVLENVAALLSRGLDAVLGTLASLGYDAEWHCIPAAAVGAPHIRDRVFVLAYTNGERCQNQPQRLSAVSVSRCNYSGTQAGKSSWWSTEPDVGRVAHGVPAILDGGLEHAHESCIEKAGTAGLPTGAPMSEVRLLCERAEASREPRRCLICGVPLSIMPRHRRPETWEVGTWEQETQGVRCVRAGIHELYAYESENMQQGVSIGTWAPQCTQTVANRVDRLRCLGNAVVPQVAYWIGQRILEAEQLRQEVMF